MREQLAALDATTLIGLVACTFCLVVIIAIVALVCVLERRARRGCDCYAEPFGDQARPPL